MGIMKYAKVTKAQVDASKDRVLLVLINAGVTKANFSFNEAFNFLLEKPDKGPLCKALIKFQRFIYSNLSDV